ncbi:arylamine N-acetyltransferase [Variovorax sp. SG517]|uniref:hypothetical protein n=1 Tax=Variovorax sp. SG517 TaxID=2587117 RepID=UPI00159EA793|nr:hypothetical protein [Variovorax sp. SG517]NVM90119.1 arylamine N-acetyltransferase [Variovorax sp. SG517]
MNITSNAVLQVLGFCIATLLATVVLVLAGLNERDAASRSSVSTSQTMKDPR